MATLEQHAEVRKLLANLGREVAKFVSQSSNTIAAEALLAATISLDPRQAMTVKMFRRPPQSREIDIVGLAVLSSLFRFSVLSARDIYVRARVLLRHGMLFAAVKQLQKLLSDEAFSQKSGSLISAALARASDSAERSELIVNLATSFPSVVGLSVLRDLDDLDKATADPKPEDHHAIPSALRAYGSYREALRSQRLGKYAAERVGLNSSLSRLIDECKLGISWQLGFLEGLSERLSQLGDAPAYERSLLLRLLYADSAQVVDDVLQRLAELGAPRVSASSRVHGAPLVLISQLQRSGGSLLAQLFDGHPDLLTMPHELRLNDPKWVWPEFDPKDAPLDLFVRFMNDRYTYFALKGYSKPDGNPAASKEVHPFLLDYPKFVATYARLASMLGSNAAKRDVLNVFFSSFSEGWTDNATPAAPFERVVAFTPRSNMQLESVAHFSRLSGRTFRYHRSRPSKLVCLRKEARP